MRNIVRFRRAVHPCDGPPVIYIPV